MKRIGDAQTLLYIIVFISVFLYVFVWSYMTIEKFLAMGAPAFDAGTSVFDAGLYMESSWSIIHSHYTLNSLLAVFFSRGIVFFIFPLALFKSYQVLFVFQSFMLGISAFPVFWIARTVLRDKLQSLSIVIVYLLYPPLAGVNWFDIHYQMLFIPFFLFGYFFYINRNYVLATLFLFLAAITHGQYSFLVMIFAFMELLHIYVSNRKEFDRKGIRNYVPMIITIFFSSFIFGMFLVFERFTGLGFHYTITGIVGLNIFSGIDSKIQTILLILLPVLFLPLFAKKWFILVIPVMFLALTANIAVYQFPALFMIQYPAMFIPFIFIGSIYGLARFNQESKGSQEKTIGGNTTLAIRFRKLEKVNYQIPLIIIIISILLASVYQPYGPIQNASSEDFGLSNILISNHIEFIEVNSMISLIPPNNPYVFFQNSMPEVLPRPLEYQGTPLMPYTVTQNLTHELFNGTWVKVTIEYAIFNPYSSFFNIPGAPPYNATAYQFLHMLMATGNYGILAEENGIILIERNYTGEPRLFIPYKAFIPASRLSTPINRTADSIYAIDPTGEVISFGPYMYLSPGTYEIRYEMKVSNNSASNHCSFLVWAEEGKVVFSRQNITGLDFPDVNEWTNVSLTLNLRNSWSSIEFLLGYGSWSGNVSIRGIYIDQTSI